MSAMNILSVHRNSCQLLIIMFISGLNDSVMQGAWGRGGVGLSSKYNAEGCVQQLPSLPSDTPRELTVVVTLPSQNAMQ